MERLQEEGRVRHLNCTDNNTGDLYTPNITIGKDQSHPLSLIVDNGKDNNSSGKDNDTSNENVSRDGEQSGTTMSSYEANKAASLRHVYIGSAMVLFYLGVKQADPPAIAPDLTEWLALVLSTIEPVLKLVYIIIFIIHCYRYGIK